MESERKERCEIQVLGLNFWGKHGVFEEERREGRHFQVDLVAELERVPGLQTDRLEDTVDYRQLAGIVEEIGQGESFRLTERLAAAIAERCLQLPRVRSVEVTVRKRTTGVPGRPAWVGVRLVRTRGPGPGASPAACEQPAPRAC
ncbi:MAG: 7,8-dihydroneopterin aldolase [Planctomycetota bacterium]|nr:MAG: 7,8-dihydroneopterin aldolase [Planctomycetota bacterium]